MHDMTRTFAVLTPGLALETISLGPEMYAELEARFDQFRGHVLISCHEFDEDWGVWERHPAGDELVMLLAGAARLVLKHRDGEKTFELSQPGSYVVVPRATWHTATVTEPTRMLFITPGEGTQNEPDPHGDGA